MTYFATRALPPAIPNNTNTGPNDGTASAPGTFVGNGPAIVLEPGEWLVCHMWWLTQAANACSVEYDGSYIEF